MYRFVAILGQAAAAELTVQRMELRPGADAIEVCYALLSPHTSLLRSLLARPPERSVEPLGDREATELRDTAIPMVVRAVVLSPGLVYAASMRVEGATLDESLYRLFDLTCRSVEFLDTPTP